MLNIEYTKYSVDLAMAFVGGYMGLLWTIVGILIGFYQDFHFVHDLTKSLYNEEKGPLGVDEHDSDDGKEVHAYLKNQKTPEYIFRNYACDSVLSSCLCCCFKN